MVLAIGLSRNVCLPAAAAARVVCRCAAFGVVLMMPSMLRSPRISSYEEAALQEYFAANLFLFSADREKQAAMVSLPERLIASARTSDHQPMPMHATFI